MTKPYELHRGDCIEVMRTMAENSIDAIVCDPPYGLEFMGKEWDGADGFRRSLNKADAGRDNSFGRMSRTSPEYRAGHLFQEWCQAWATEALRVLKPGGHLLAFSGSRTYHRMACAIEDAGFQVRDRVRFECSPETKYGALLDSLTADQRGAVLELLNDQLGLGSELAWAYGSGFPKSLDVGKAIDKAGGVDTKAFKADLRASVLRSGMTRKAIDDACGFTMRFDTPYEDDPRCWGVSLPSPEKWATICAVLGLDASRWSELVNSVWRGRAGAEISGNSAMSGANFERTDKGDPVHDAARQWDGWGTALKPAHEPICVARKPLIGTVAANVLAHGTGALNIDGCRVGDEPITQHGRSASENRAMSGSNYAEESGRAWVGRWPANIIHDGSAEVVALFPAQAGAQAPVTKRNGDKFRTTFGTFAGNIDEAGSTFQGDTGSAARFFYCAKTSSTDRHEGLENPGPQFKKGSTLRDAENLGDDRKGNHHPTVKPTDLMAYLCRLVTPPGGHVLDPFMGSGSTGKACMREGFRFTGIDLGAEYVAIAAARIEHELERVTLANTPPPPSPQMDLFGGEDAA